MFWHVGVRRLPYIKLECTGLRCIFDAKSAPGYFIKDVLLQGFGKLAIKVNSTEEVGHGIQCWAF